jgi:deoxyribodipyrimidine photo-lyase
LRAVCDVALARQRRRLQALGYAETGYDLVDAGIRELVETGFMHNRVRMVVASFLTKHLLCDWRWGEHFFAQYLLDYELASNVGGWQWSASIGVDAAPYFQIFNPVEQQKKYDADGAYVRRWLGAGSDLLGALAGRSRWLNTALRGNAV